MKLECLRDKLKWSVSLAEKISGKNLSLPSLSYVLLQGQKNFLSVKATNLEIGLEIKLPAKVETLGEVMVSGAVLANLLANLPPSDKIQIGLVKNNLVVSSTRNSSLVKTYPADDFPTFQTPKIEQWLKLPSRSLLEGVRSVWYAAANSDIKPEISSVYVYLEGNELFFVATDSFRLAEKKITLEQTGGGPSIKSAFILPLKSAAEILRIFEGEDINVSIGQSDHQLFITTDNIRFSSRLVEGVFPDYKQIIPAKATTEVVVGTQDLLGSLRLASVFSDRLNQVWVKVGVKDRHLEIGSRGEIGETTTTLEAVLEGEDTEVNFNVKYLLDCLSVVSGDSLNLKFSGSNRPLVISAVGDSGFRYLVMPLNR